MLITFIQMIFKIPELIEFLSADTTLLPGTVILTGTPSGVGKASNPPRWLKAGDKIIVEIEKNNDFFPARARAY
jgi:2-keto-4-pentenoate hydratase/2-oxohepta-3-ene-1,7-dioic acid hydratase in catechol pathway